MYTSEITATGTFDFTQLEGEGAHSIEWDLAVLGMGISGPTAIVESVDLQFGDKTYSMSPGTTQNAVMGKGIHSKIDLTDMQKADFKVVVRLKGYDHLYFEPTASNTTVRLSSDWSNPGFVGSTLADKHTITDDGFSAVWNVSEFGRMLPDLWSDREYTLGSHSATFGVDLINPVDHYQKNMRSAKYAMLIISLTFTVFFFFEMLGKKKVHPIQYGFVGVALILFYYLLLSISEHLGFAMAYMIASGATILLITGYSASLLRSWKSALLLLGILTVLYSYIYVLLQLEEFALIAGSIGLFVILAIVMYLSRNVDWYKASNDVTKS